MMNDETRKFDARPWADIKRDYEACAFQRIDDLCDRYGITRGMLYSKVTHGNWKRRVVKVEASPPLSRLKRLAQRKIERLEEAEAGAEDLSDGAIDKLSGLLRLVERISTLEQKEKAAERARKPPKLVNDARRLELARRIEAIQRQLELERNHQPAEG